MLSKRKFSASSKVAMDEIVPNGGVHEVITKSGDVVYFFLKRGESMPEKFMRLYLENVDANIARVPKEQQPAMRARAEDMARDLGVKI